MEMMYYQLANTSYQDYLKVLEADIHHANSLAAAIPRAKGGERLEMRLVYNHLSPVFLFLLQWMECSCICLLSRYLNLFHILVYKVYSDGSPKLSTCGRKATIEEFYGIILPSLQLLHGNLGNSDYLEEGHPSTDSFNKKRVQRDNRIADIDWEREEECGICLEPCTKIVLPNCCHAMCIKCYRNWNIKSESCPFCRGSLRRVNSEDLWVLTCNGDVVDTKTISKEDLLRFYLYINNLPKDYPDVLFLVYYEYLI